MADQQLSLVLRHLRGLAGTQHSDWPDRELLAAFATRNDQAAFTTLVKRYGPMVLGICGRVLHHAHDAEDAFQATFILLARRGAGIRRPESLASWLHGVAYRIANNAKRSASRRHEYEGSAQPAPPAGPMAELARREVQALFDEEVQRLPEVYRAPSSFAASRTEGRQTSPGYWGSKGGLSGAACVTRHKAVWVLPDQAWMPSPLSVVQRLEVVTGPFAYVRLLGHREAVDALTPKLDHIVIDRVGQVADDAEAIKLLAKRVPVVAFVNNHFAGYAPETLRQLVALLA
jgi:hypothetical protein